MVSYTYSQGDSGGLTKVIAETFETWAKIEQKGGTMNFSQAQLMADATYQVTIRYRAGVTQNWNIIYEGQTMQIKAITLDNPGYKRYMIIDCGLTIKQQSWS